VIRMCFVDENNAVISAEKNLIRASFSEKGECSFTVETDPSQKGEVETMHKGRL